MGVQFWDLEQCVTALQHTNPSKIWVCILKTIKIGKFFNTLISDLNDTQGNLLNTIIIPITEEDRHKRQNIHNRGKLPPFIA